MYYPTVVCKESNLRHIVKDKHICECGFKYHYFNFNQKDLRKIKFKPVPEITCPKCRAIIESK